MQGETTILTERQKAALLFANEAFYIAFANGDYEAMEAVWAENFEKVSCLHPGWEPLFGRNNVMASWKAVLSNPPEISDHSPNAFGVEEMGYVICYERIGGTHLLATNVFVLEDGEWRMTHHQSGPTEAYPPDEESDNLSHN